MASRAGNRNMSQVVSKRQHAPATAVQQTDNRNPHQSAGGKEREKGGGGKNREGPRGVEGGREGGGRGGGELLGGVTEEGEHD